MQTLAQILASPEYRKLNAKDQMAAKRRFYRGIVRDKGFQSLPSKDRLDIARMILSAVCKPESETKVSHAETQQEDVKEAESEVVSEVDEEEDEEKEEETDDIDSKAHEAATSPTNGIAEPTQAQKEAGNYKKGHIVWQGLDISIENPKGSNRSGIGPKGEPWSVTMPAHYGYLKRTEGADGDHLDIYLGDTENDKVFIVNQLDADTGKFDEHKIIAKVGSKNEAENLYQAGFSDNRASERMGMIVEMTIPEFKEWLKSSDTSKPLHKEKKTKSESDD